MTDEVRKLSLLGQSVFYTSQGGITRPAVIVHAHPTLDEQRQLVNLLVFTDFANDRRDPEFAASQANGTAWATTKRESVDGPRPGYWSWGSK